MRNVECRVNDTLKPCFAVARSAKPQFVCLHSPGSGSSRALLIIGPGPFLKKAVEFLVVVKMDKWPLILVKLDLAKQT